MLSYIELAFAWLLFISMPLLAAGMFYQANKYHSMRMHSEAASGFDRFSNESTRLLRYGTLINLICGMALCAVFAAILLFGLSFAVWSGSAALIVWAYFIALMRFNRHQAKLSAS